MKRSKIAAPSLSLADAISTAQASQQAAQTAAPSQSPDAGDQPFQMMAETGTGATEESEMDNMTEITSDNKLEQQIINQAKAVSI